MTTKKVLVTGAGKGIGFEITRNLLESGHQVLAISRNLTALKKLQEQYPSIHILKVDITQEEQLKALTEYIGSHFGTLDILIHNAGKLINKPFDNTTFQDFMEVYKVNVFAVAELTRCMLPYLTEGSHVVAISSMGGVQGSAKFPGLAAYSSSKGALITLMELLAEEYKTKGICFNSLALGAVQTEMLRQAFPGYEAPVTPERMASYISDFALKGHEFYNGKVLQVSSSTP
ncbi:MAG: SDR family oxidoreductase [Flavobacteriaceae bacterium]|nr:SDR family oxidoreductase [Flavobacteriaceae bacterium]